MNKDNLLFYILFLRFTPLVPNVSINVSAPIVGLPFKYFFFGTLIGTATALTLGLMPGNIIHIRTGLAIQELNDLSTSYQVSLCSSLGPRDAHRTIAARPPTHLLQEEAAKTR